MRARARAGQVPEATRKVVAVVVVMVVVVLMLLLLPLVLLVLVPKIPETMLVLAREILATKRVSTDN